MAKAFHMTLALADTLWVSRNQVCSSLIVVSGRPLDPFPDCAMQVSQFARHMTPLQPCGGPAGTAAAKHFGDI